MSQEIANRLRDVATRYNAAIDAGKIRPLRKVVEESHKAVTDAQAEIRVLEQKGAELEVAANALLLDIRFGRKTTRFVL